MIKTKSKNNSIIGYFNLGLCIMLWGAIPVVSKKAMIDIDNIQLLFYSTVFSTLILGFMVVWERKWKVIKSYKVSDYLHMGSLGFLGNYLYYIFLYGALARTTASEGFIIAYMWPIFVMVLSFVILKEKVTGSKISNIAISFLGMIIIATNGNILSMEFTNPYGDFLAICGAFVFALYSVLGKKVEYDNTFSVFIYFLTALIFLIPTMIMTVGFALPQGGVWIWIILNGCFVNGISYVFWFKALEHGRTEIIANLLYLTPFVSLIYISLFLDEKILASSIVGLIIIVSGVVNQYLMSRNKYHGQVDIAKK
ncbi:Permease of the drug/metabolite transporter (DMT) superfamily [Dethiosulfatibacter aminovorans DSM 17477]|uniref:Permease of the drug/metabolite transporter (DMT) superfamily n=1 Tax=Dethiosulfatibacter aminovorans DSM 17477 TaxID=1121476 RepID=A0A1M6CBM5_9FIRM|nr:DMT family transporter [Dethiosulfatibacter aminovorans]SHI58397.1 Permease of the drug/metabolite transporter (DMT) superfamily [Dethiosulfatibacter aminovorans DSM 17477]